MASPEPVDLVLVVDVGNSGAKVGAVRGEDVAGPTQDENVRVLIVDAEGTRLVITAVSPASATDAEEAPLQSLLDSILIAPLAP